MLPQSSMLPISQPVKSAKYNVSVVNAAVDETTSSAATSTNSTTPQMHAKHDLVVWFEVLELGEKLSFVLPPIVLLNQPVFDATVQPPTALSSAED